ncbi:carbohydrate-binding module family 13 protein [Cenococcum geophilum 1.58]|uniref:carbohydrate-binding module family 13 protein n=1 Tax=Cenococcum geophilum 1.58 TaxID=794803 RepID=UPI00358F1D12|nr:carbohydrate-binding module family 13 protein [Cenococcum geophilum 1.58]
MSALQEGVYFIRNRKTKTLVTADLSTPNPKLVGSKFSFDDINQQLFSLKKIGQDNTYLITHVNTGRVVDLYGGIAADETPIITFPAHYGANQQWEISTSSNAYKIKSKSSGKLVDLFGSNEKDGTAIINYIDVGGENQLWEFKRVGSYVS